jgi:uncharacterized protein
MARDGAIAAAALQQRPLGVPIVDCHGHVGLFGSQHIPRAGSASALVDMMDTLGITTLCLSSHLALSPDESAGNASAVEAARSHPGRLAVYVVYNPTRPPNEAAEEVRRHLGDPAVIGIKLHTTLHQAGAGDARFRPAYELAREAGKLVLCHTWGVADVRGIEEMARAFPTVPILMGHSGGYETAAMEEAVRVARACPAAFLDLTLSGMFDGVIEAFVRDAGAEKVLFGSDMPFIDPRANLGRVVFARIPDAAKEMILGATMRRLLDTAGFAR